MALDKTGLKAALKAAFDTAKSDGWTTDQVAGALADAIDAYVKGGDVTGVTVEVKNPGGTVIGTGVQTGTGKVG